MTTETNRTSHESQPPLHRNRNADAEIFRELQALKAKTRRTGHDRVIVLIAACILHGWDEGGRIIGALVKLGFNQKYVGIILRTNTGDDPKRYFWKRVADGIYSIHPGLLETESAASIVV